MMFSRPATPTPGVSHSPFSAIFLYDGRVRPRGAPVSVFHHRSLTERRSSLPPPAYINTVYLFPTLCSTVEGTAGPVKYFAAVCRLSAAVEACFRVAAAHVVQID